MRAATRCRRRSAALAIFAALAGLPAPAGAGGPPLTVDPAKQAYAFDDPAILVRQIIFGLAHGVTLLARSCLDAADDLRRPTQAAYEEWLVRYGERIIDSEQGLARHYFGPRAGEATEDDIARALNLPPKLDLPATPDRLKEACASFPEALSRKRYNLDLLFTAHRDEQRLGRAIEVRAAVGECRQIAERDALPGIDAALSRWEGENGAIEATSRTRWLKFRGDENELRRWQEAIGGETRRRLPAMKPDSETACRKLIDDLASPRYSLSALMGDGTAPPASESPTGDIPPKEDRASNDDR